MLRQGVRSFVTSGRRNGTRHEGDPSTPVTVKKHLVRVGDKKNPRDKVKTRTVQECTAPPDSERTASERDSSSKDNTSTKVQVGKIMTMNDAE